MTDAASKKKYNNIVRSNNNFPKVPVHHTRYNIIIEYQCSVIIIKIICHRDILLYILILIYSVVAKGMEKNRHLSLS